MVRYRTREVARISMENDTFRLCKTSDLAAYRTEYERDYARVLHSPSFRRLGNKTQLFPGNESDFFRNRLTHSLEVSQIAKAIAKKILVEQPTADVQPEVCAVAGIIHDLGHPPFGHNGERALDDCMKKYGGFEGNAQTIRIITRLEKKDKNEQLQPYLGEDYRVGLNLTARVIAAVVKYDETIPETRRKDVDIAKGYYESEKPIIMKVKEALGIGEIKSKIKTTDCAVMELGDDIAYSTYDVEDAFKAGFLSPVGMMTIDDYTLNQIVERMEEKDRIKITKGEAKDTIFDLFSDVTGEIASKSDAVSFYERSRVSASSGYNRVAISSGLVNEFIDGVELERNEKHPILSEVRFKPETHIKVSLLKHFSFISIINSSRLKVAENRGYDIVKGIFDKLSSKNGFKLLPEDFQEEYRINSDKVRRMRVICDFVSGMTDRYAIEFYGRLYSATPQTIFKPL